MKRLLFIFSMLLGVAYGQICADEDTVRSNSVSLITYNSARINGTTSHFSGSVSSLQLKYVRVGQTDTVTSSGSSALRNITGLQANTQYVYYYKTICGSGSISQTIGAYTFTTKPNSVVYTDMPAMGYQFKHLKPDSSLGIPSGDTGLTREPSTLPQIRYKSSDNTFYGYYPSCSCWRALAIDSAGIIALLDGKVDSVTVSGDSLFYWKQGVSYGYILPSLNNIWRNTGNSGIDTSVNWLGTNDNKDLVIKTYGERRITINVNGALGIGDPPEYGSLGQILQSSGNSAPISWISNPASELSPYDNRVNDGYHTAFGVSGEVNGVLFVAQSEGTGHPLVAGTVPVVFTSSDKGKTYTKQYLSLTGISGAASDDIRNLAGGVDNNGKVWIFGTDYRNAAETDASRLWYWTSTDNCATFSNPVQITYDTTVYDLLTFYGGLVDLGGGTLVVPAYGSNGGLAESYAVQFKSTNSGSAWTATKVYTGDNTSGSDQVTETFILNTTGTNLVAIARREQAKPRLFVSTNSGTSWTSKGAITKFPSNQCHAPWMYKDGDVVSCIYSDRTALNIGRLNVSTYFDSLNIWNASTAQVVSGSVTQRGFGAYNYGYTSTIGTGDNRRMVWYDISLDENTPGSLSNALTSLIISPLVSKPAFVAQIANASVSAGGAEDDLYFDSTLIDCDNYGGLERTNYKKWTVPEDGLYQINCNIRVGSQGFATYTQLTVYSDFVSTAYRDKPIMQGGCIGQGFGFIAVSGVRHLRKGETINFKLYSSATGPLSINADDPPMFSIYKIQ